MTTIKYFALDESGATAIEYGLIAGMIALVVISAIAATGDGVMAKWDLVMKKVTAAMNGSGGEGGDSGDGGA